MKNIIYLLIFSITILISCSENITEKKAQKEETKCAEKSEKKCDSESKKGCSSKKDNKHSGGHDMELPEDTRISLNVSGKKAEHQLLNMRDHLVVVNLIVGYLANDKYDEASELAKDRLGYSTEMQLMCSSFGEEFGAIGFDFHKSAETMSDVFKTKDKKKSLEALNTTMGYCVACHAKFKQ